MKTESATETQDQPDRELEPYDGRRLSYATTFRNPWKAGTIRIVEWLTGKAVLLYKVRRFERSGVPTGHAFFSEGLKAMGVEIETPRDAYARIPEKGPLVVVSNHPHGLVDGIVLAEIIGTVRKDYKILTRSLLTGVKEIEGYMLPVAFPHEENAVQTNLDMRRTAMAHLKDDGVIILFPAGQVAVSKTAFGPAVEAEWNPFTAKMILRSGASVLPVYFPGQNSRAYQIADKISATLRQGLLLHEIKYALNKPQRPVIGDLITPEELKAQSTNTTGFMAWLREKTLNLREE